MKSIDALLGAVALALSTCITLSLFAGFSYWTYAALGEFQQQIVARANASVASTRAGTLPSPAAPGELPVVRMEPVTVIGHRSDGESFASAAAPASR